MSPGAAGAAAGASGTEATGTGTTGAEATGAGTTGPPPGAVPPPPVGEKKPFWKKWWFWLLVAIAAALIATIIWLLLRGVEVPDVVGLSVDEAQAVADEAGLVFVVSGTEYSTDLEPDVVISQSPEAGEKAKKDDQLSVVVSTDTEVVIVPDVTGQDALQAVNTLQAAGFTVAEIIGEESEEPQGTVIAQDPEAGSEANIGTEVTITLSQGPADESVGVPNLVGMQQDVAEEMLGVLGLVSESSTVASSAPVGEVVAQTPAAGTTLQTGDTVVIVASDGSGTTTTSSATSTTASSTSTTQSATTSTTVPNQVTIVGLIDMAFDPEEITISAGDTVTWFNDDIEVHIIMADDDSFGSEPLDPGDIFTYTFDSTGTFGYHCDLHPDEMGTVIVQ